MKKANSPPSPLLSHVLLIVNPAAGARSKRKKLHRIIADLRQKAGHLEILYTAAALDASRLVREKAAEPWTLLLCAGGDGTINEVINGLMAGPGAPPPLGILPTGTGNGLARELRLPLDPWRAYQSLIGGTPRTIFPGKVALKSPSGESASRYFILLAGAGFDAYVADWVERRAPFFRRLPKLAVYLLFGLIGIFRYRYPLLRFSIEGRGLAGSTGVVARARLVAGPMTFAPAGDLAAPLLLLCLLPQRGRLGYLRLMFRLLLRGTPGSQVAYHPAREIVMHEGAGKVQADGELLGPPPATFTLAEKPIRLIYPAERSVRRGLFGASRSSAPGE